MARLSDKYNESCLKIFALLLLFFEGEADFNDVINIFADEDGKISQNSNVLLNKYMNTVKIFGVEVEKSKGKYILKHMPFSLTLTEDDLQAVALMKSALNFLASGKNKTNLSNLVRNLENLYDKDTRKLNCLIKNVKNYDLSFYFKKFETKIEECEEYIQNNSKIEVTYSEDDKDVIIACIPKEIKYLDKSVNLSVFNTMNRQIVDIPFSSIKNISKISKGKSKAKEQSCTTVIYKLKGDLANRYRLREWERAEGKDANGWLTVINSGEDFKLLTSRLLRYDDKCVVVSPEYFKNDMVKTIDNMLSVYQ